MRSQGFFHPATLVPSELEYAEGYRARMNVVWSKMRPITNNQQKSHPQPHQEKQITTQQPKPHIKPPQKTTKPKPLKAKTAKPKQKSDQPETKSE